MRVPAPSVFVRYLLALLIAVYAAPMWAAQSKPIELTVLEVKEKSYNSHPALAVRFSTPLKAKNSFANRLRVVTDDIQHKKGEVSGEWVLGSNNRILYFPYVEPGAKYRVTIRRGLEAANGTTLANTSEHNVETREQKPAFGFASEGSVLVPGVTDGLPIMTVQTPDVDVEFMRVDDESLVWFVEHYYNKRNTSRYYVLRNVAKKAQSVYLGRFHTTDDKYARTVTKLPVFDIDELKKPGMYIAVMKSPGTFGYNVQKTSFFFVSDIGMQVRHYADKLQVTTTSLKTGQPLPDVKLTLYRGLQGQPVHPYTDAKGIAGFPGNVGSNAVIVAEKGEHFSVLQLGRPALDLSDFVVDGPNTHPYEAYLFSNRDLFRPGEALDLSVLLRDGDGSAVADMPLTVKLKQPDGRTQATVNLSTEATGYYSNHFAIPSDAATGTWKAEAYVDNSGQPVGEFAFHVEEFLPERMKLDLDSEQKAVGPDEEWQVGLTGAFLYGAPASENKYEAVLNVSRNRHPFDKYRDYTFGDVSEDAKAYREDVSSGKLDKEGKADVTIKPRKSYHSPMRLRLSASLFESGGRPLSRSIDATYFPADAVVGVRPLYSGKNAESHSSPSFELVRLNQQGEPAPSRNLEVTLEREEYDYYWGYYRGNGWKRDVTISTYPVNSWNVATDKNGLAKISVPVEWGYYRIVVKDSSGAVSRYRFRAGWRRDDGGKSARPDAVNLVLDKPGYKPGDTVNVDVVSPHAGKGLIRIESDKLLWQKWVDVPAKGAKVSIPFQKEWDGKHNLYISAVVYRPGDAGNEVTPNRAVGVMHLPLDRSERKLKVDVSAPDKVAPQHDLNIDVSVPGAAGKEVYAVVAAVDSGILNITNFKTPDAGEYFFKRRAYEVKIQDLFDRVIEAMKGRKAKRRFGGDADTAQASQRSRSSRAEVQMVAFTSGLVKLDKTGKGKVSFPMPEFNGELRVMAVVFTAKSFGSAETKVKVRAPVVAELTLPRFMAFGDQALGALELHNLSGKAQTLQVGLTSHDPIGISNVPEQVTLADGERKHLRFPIKAGNHFGVSDVHLSVQGDGVDVDRNWQLGVRAPWHGDKRVRHLTLKAGEEQSLPLDMVEGLRPATVEAVLTIAAQPPLEIRDAIQGLLHYPYGCLEQTTSAAYPYLYVSEEKAHIFGIEPKTMAERAKAIAAAIKRISGMQLSNGGFALWNRSGREEPWLTPYAVNFLYEAREKGFSVPTEMLQKGIERLDEMLRRGVSVTRGYHRDSRDHLRFASRAFAAYVLAKMGRAPLGSLRTLYEYDHDKAQSGLPLVHLGLAMVLQGDREQGEKVIAEGLKKKRGSHYLSDYGSEIRDNGLMIALLYRHHVDVDGRDELLFQLSKTVRERHYLSTQERTALFRAGDALMLSQSREVNLQLTRKGETRSVQGGVLKNLMLDKPEADESLTVHSNADKNQYLTLTVTGYTEQPPEPVTEHYNIERTLYTMDGEKVDGHQVKSGDFFIVHLTVSAEKWSENVLVEELLPAGFEVENLNLSKGEGLDNITIDEINAGSAMRDDAIRHVEYRDDRFVAAAEVNRYRPLNLFYMVRAVSPGSFSYPPPLVEDMYDAERIGVGESPGQLTVISSGE